MRKSFILSMMIVLSLFITGCKKPNNDPVISGPLDVSILQGSTFDEWDGITATDEEDGDITELIELDGFVNSLILGEHALTYTVEDADGNTDRVSITITVYYETADDNAVYNGDFSLGEGGWTFDKPGGEATFVVTNDELVVTITDLAQEWWNLQVHQSISIEDETTYKFTFDAKSAEGKRVGVGIEDTADGYAMLPGGDVVFELTAEYETYEYYFTSDRTIDTGKFVIYLGRIGLDEELATVYLDNIQIEEVTLDTTDLVILGADEVNLVLNESFEPLAGVTAEAGDGTDLTSSIELSNVVVTELSKNAIYILQYSVTDGTTTLYHDRIVNIVLGKDNAYELFNTDFSLGVTGWSLDFPVGTGNMTVVDGVLVAELTDLGTEWWHIQLFQSEISIEEGKTYMVSFEAKADGSKRVGLGIEDPADGYVDLKGESIEWDLTTEWVTYEYSFTAPRTIDTTKYAIFLGSMLETDVLTTVYIDDFQVIEAEDSSPLISGAGSIDVIQGTTFTVLDGVTASDIEDGDITTNITTSGTVDTDTLGEYEVDYEVTDSFGNTTVVTRTVSVVLGGNPWEMFNTGFDLGTLSWNLDFNDIATGTFTVVDGVLEVDITNVGNAFWHVQVYQDNKQIDMDTMYKVSFRAKADVAKSIELGIEDPANGYASLKEDTAVWELTTEWVTYEYMFDPSISIDTAKYVLLIGNITGTDPNTKVYIDDFTVEEFAASVNVNPNMETTDAWVFDFPGGAGTMSYVNGEIEAVLTDLSDAWWKIQLQQDGISIVEGHYYLVSVDLKTDTPRRVGLGIEDTADGYADLKGESIEWDITTEYQTYYYVLRANRTIDSAKLALFFGQITGTDGIGTIYIDNFDMVEANGLNILLNSGFADNSVWNYDFPGGAGTMEAIDNQCVIALTDIGDAWWKIQLHQTDVTVEAGVSYLVTFKASSDVARRIELGIEDPANGYADLKGEVVGWEIDGDLRTYTYIFTSGESIDTAKFAIFLGQITGTDPLSNLIITDFAVFIIE